MKCYITTSADQTRKTGEVLAGELKGGEMICLQGELGSGKTTFTQGFLKGLGVKGPYTSPTFLVMKNYKCELKVKSEKLKVEAKNLKRYQILNTRYQILNVYHIDAYRVGSKDILSLGWEEIINDTKNVVIIEWADRIKDIIPKGRLWVKFRVAGKNSRMIEVGTR